MAQQVMNYFLKVLIKSYLSMENLKDVNIVELFHPFLLALAQIMFQSSSRKQVREYIFVAA